jgi:hypothetical protein
MEETATPQQRRIQSLTCRHGGKDCVVEVGQPSPFDGTEVLAIVDLGHHAGFTVSHASGAPDVQLGRHVYSVTEFA